MLYTGTRGDYSVSSSYAILKGICDDRGLFVPNEFPKIELEQFLQDDYQDMAFQVLKLFLTDFDESTLKQIIFNAYGDNFKADMVAPVVKKGGYYFLELFHGRTLAFKDVALSILPYLLTESIKMQNYKKDVIILTATSGDTGKAALEGFSNVDGTQIVVFYPKEGVSEIQRLQMVTTEGQNTKVVGVAGNFDDCQTAVKDIFTDKELADYFNEKGYIFSSANSINIGRLLPQIVYYFHSYKQMINAHEINLGDKINFVVPTGNFGNILAGYMAKQMGLPINKLICASNENNVLSDFFETGIYNAKREFHTTISPSMDIIISSNLERLLYFLCKDKNMINDMMNKLQTEGKYTFNIQGKEFAGEYLSDEDTKNNILKMYKDSGYVIDTHTAVALGCYNKYRQKTGDETKTIILSTASPYKFLNDVLSALNIDTSNYIDYMLDKMHEVSKTDIPKEIKDITKKVIQHTHTCDKEDAKDIVKSFFS